MSSLENVFFFFCVRELIVFQKHFVNFKEFDVVKSWLRIVAHEEW